MAKSSNVTFLAILFSIAFVIFVVLPSLTIGG